MAIGGILGGAAGLASAIMQSRAQQDANNISLLNYYNTRDTNDRIMRMMQAPRNDPYGNRVTFDPFLGVKYDIEGMTQAILDAQQQETLASLTDDARRNREFAERVDERSRHGHERFFDVQNELDETKRLHDSLERPTEEEFAADYTQRNLLARREGLDEVNEVLARQAIRLGNSNALPEIFKQADRTHADSMADAILAGRQAGRQEFRQNEQFMDAQEDREVGDILRRMGIYESLASQNQNMPQRFTNHGERLESSGDQALSNLFRGLTNKQQTEGVALDRYAKGVANSAPDLSGLARALASINIGGGTGNDPTYVRGTVVDPFYQTSNPSQGIF